MLIVYVSHKTHKIGLGPYLSANPIESLSHKSFWYLVSIRVSAEISILTSNYKTNSMKKLFFPLNQHLEEPTDSAIRNPSLIFLDLQKASESLFTEG